MIFVCLPAHVRACERACVSLVRGDQGGMGPPLSNRLYYCAKLTLKQLTVKNNNPILLILLIIYQIIIFKATKKSPTKNNNKQITTKHFRVRVNTQKRPDHSSETTTVYTSLLIFFMKQNVLQVNQQSV